jgi:hypothetical protein
MSDDRFERLCALAATLGMDLQTARWATKDERGSSYIIKDAEGNVHAEVDPIGRTTGAGLLVGFSAVPPC